MIASICSSASSNTFKSSRFISVRILSLRVFYVVTATLCWPGIALADRNKKSHALTISREKRGWFASPTALFCPFSVGLIYIYYIICSVNNKLFFKPRYSVFGAYFLTSIFHSCIMVSGSEVGSRFPHLRKEGDGKSRDAGRDPKPVRFPKRGQGRFFYFFFVHRSCNIPFSQ